jgi:hypothetical protein
MLRVPDLRRVLGLVWEDIAPARLAGVIVRLLPLGLGDSHTQNFACAPKLINRRM